MWDVKWDEIGENINQIFILLDLGGKFYKLGLRTLRISGVCCMFIVAGIVGRMGL